MKTVTVKEIVNYKGHSIKANGIVDLSFSAMYDEITNSIKCLQMLNNDISILAKLPDEKPIKLGIFRINSINFDHDGESNLKFKSIDDAVELDNLSKIITNEKVQIKMDAEIDEEEEGQNG